MASSTGSVNVFYDFIEDPRRASESVCQDAPVGLGFIAYLFAALSAFLAEAVAGRLGVFSASLVSLSVIMLWHVGAGIVQAAEVVKGTA